MASLAVPFPSPFPWHGLKHEEGMKPLRRRRGDRNSNGKQSSISCCGEVPQRATANFSLECLDDTSFLMWPSKATGNTYWKFSPQGALLGCTPLCPPAHRVLPGPSTLSCCEGPFASHVSRYPTLQQPPLPWRHPNCQRPIEVVVWFKPTLFGNIALLQNRARNLFSRKKNSR